MVLTETSSLFFVPVGKMVSLGKFPFSSSLCSFSVSWLSLRAFIC